MLRVQLIEEVLGSLKRDDQDPKGINEVTQTVKRSAENEGILYEIVLEMVFIKAYRRFLKLAYETRGGIDAKVLANVYKLNPNTRRWGLYAEAQTNNARFEITEDTLTTNLEQVGFQRRILNLLERAVDLETTTSENGSPLPAQSVINPTYHSKVIYKTTKAQPKPEDLVQFPQTDVVVFNVPPGHHDRGAFLYGGVATDNLVLAELSTIYQLPFGWTDFNDDAANFGPMTSAEMKAYLLARKDTRFEFYRADEAGTVKIHANLQFQHQFISINVGPVDVCGDASLGTLELRYWFEIRDESNNIVYLEEVGQWDTTHACVDDYTGAMELHTLDIPAFNIKVGYKMYCYSVTRVYGNYNNTNVVGSSNVGHNFYILPGPDFYITVENASVAPTSTAKTILLYEAFQRCCQYYTNQLDCFRSTLLGRTDLGYAEDGYLSLAGVTNGSNLRGRNVPIFSSLQDLIDFGNSIACTGFGFEKLPDGKWVLVFEKREYFYDKGLKILSLGKVAGVKRPVYSKLFWNKVDYGFETKVDVGQVNALDEFNTKRSHSLSVTNTKSALKISTKMVTGGYQIEAQRRLSNSTEDGKLDDANFAIRMIRDGLTYKPMKNEGYTLIENILSPETVYNIDWHPSRTLRNWYPILASAMVYTLTKKITFLSGEVNFRLRTQKTGEDFICDDRGEVDLSGVVATFTGFKLIFTDHPFTADQLAILKQRQHGYIEFEDLFGSTFNGFISDTGVEHDDNKGTASFDLLEVNFPKV